MKKHYILHDMNLSSVFVAPKEDVVSLTFLDMRDGNTTVIITCNQVFAFRKYLYSTPLPLYVGEVSVELVRVAENGLFRNDSAESLSGFTPRATYFPNKELEIVHVEGGEVDIDIICVSHSVGTTKGGITDSDSGESAP